MRRSRINYLDLFAGIGGFVLGAEWAGLTFNAHYFPEVDDYAIRIYKRHFPNAIELGDVRGIRYEHLPCGSYLVTAGFPCQPHSTAGHRRGDGDERDLWPECSRMLRELRPRIALFENVPGLFTSNGGRFFNRVLSDIHESGYDAEWQMLSAFDAGAPQKRDRLFIVAYPQSRGLDCHKTQAGKPCTPRGKATSERLRLWTDGTVCVNNRLYPKFEFYRMADGVPEEMDAVKGLGNAVVPQVAAMIFERIRQWLETP